MPQVSLWGNKRQMCPSIYLAAGNAVCCVLQSAASTFVCVTQLIVRDLQHDFHTAQAGRHS